MNSLVRCALGNPHTFLIPPLVINHSHTSTNFSVAPSSVHNQYFILVAIPLANLHYNMIQTRNAIFLLSIVFQRLWFEIEIPKHAKLCSWIKTDLYFALMIPFSWFLSNNSTRIQIELSKCYWLHDVEKLNVFQIAEWRNVLAIFLELSNLARHKRLKPWLVVSQKMGLLTPHWWTFICRQQNTQFDVSTKTQVLLPRGSGTLRWSFKDNFICHNQFWHPITFQSFPLGRRPSHCWFHF